MILDFRFGILDYPFLQIQFKILVFELLEFHLQFFSSAKSKIQNPKSKIENGFRKYNI